MPIFEYQGKDAKGKVKKGRIETQSLNRANEQLIRADITPISIEEVSDASAHQFNLGQLFKRDKPNLEDLMVFSRQMYNMTKAGVSLIRSLTLISQATRCLGLKNALHDIILSLESGVSLSRSMSLHPSVFSSLLVSMVEVGENTGHLDDAFLQINRYLQSESTTIKRIKGATRYPILVICAILVAIIIINVFVIPSFKGFFTSFGADLPLPTLILIACSDFMIAHWPLLLIGTLTGIIGLNLYVKTPKGQVVWGKWKLKIPLVGSIVERAMLARFSRSFSMTLKAGVPMLQALTVVAKSVNNPFIEQKIVSMRSGLERGDALCATAIRTQMFTPLVMQMLLIGEETGDIDGMLEQVSDFYEQEVDYDLARLSDAIEPILISFIAGVVLILALGVFLPMWDISSVAFNQIKS